MFNPVLIILLLATLSFCSEMTPPALANQTIRCGPWKSVQHFQIGERKAQIILQITDERQCSFDAALGRTSLRTMKVKWQGEWREVKEFCTKEMIFDLDGVYAEPFRKGLIIWVGPAPGEDGYVDDPKDAIGVVLSGDEMKCVNGTWSRLQ